MPTGPSSSKSPYLVGSEPNVSFTSIITTGDALPGSTSGVFGGIPDGIGMFDNGNGTVTVLVTHETRADTGPVRDHGSTGSYVTSLIINKSNLKVISGDDAIKSLSLWNSTTESYELSNATTGAINRLCSADLPDVTAYFNAATGLGTTTRIFMAGEETGAEGRPFGIIVSGADAGKAFELPSLGNTSYENLVANPFAQDKTIVVTTDDTTPGQVYVYIGDKQATGSEIDKAGLTNGLLYGIKVNGITAETNGNVGAMNTTFTLEAVGADGNVKNKTGAQIQADSVADGITEFLRPEDAAWDPQNPNVLYFATTNNFTSPSRLWKATFTDITKPELGGTIEAVLDGTEGPKMIDNITVANGKVMLQEDPGNQSYVAKIWEYDIATDKVTEAASFDPAQFTSGLPGFITQDEESSGIIDVTATFGDANTRAYLLDAQIHKATNDPKTIEPGQLLLMKVETPRWGGAGNDKLNGDAAANTLLGFAGNDTIKGGSGNDFLAGGLGNDKLEGGNGDDTLIGGLGDERMFGGAGADLFVFENVQKESSARGLGYDYIEDFQQGQDFIVLGSDISIAKETHLDWNKDGVMDTRLDLAGSIKAVVFVLGVADITADDIVTLSAVEEQAYYNTFLSANGLYM